MSTLEITLLYLLAAVLGVVVCRSIKLPPMLGYLAVGVLIGPHALGLTPKTDTAHHLGEFGVVFLMFVIGLEFNLPKLRAMRSHVFGLGLFQVVLTIALATGGMLLLDINQTNNSFTLAPNGPAAATKWSMRWIVWLQDALLSWIALV